VPLPEARTTMRNSLTGSSLRTGRVPVASSQAL
jgi:hypothetical protein